MRWNSTRPDRLRIHDSCQFDPHYAHFPYSMPFVSMAFVWYATMHPSVCISVVVGHLIVIECHNLCPFYWYWLLAVAILWQSLTCLLCYLARDCCAYCGCRYENSDDFVRSSYAVANDDCAGYPIWIGSKRPNREQWRKKFKKETGQKLNWITEVCVVR